MAANSARGGAEQDGMAPIAALRRDAEHISAGLPALLAKAERLAATIILGAHGRRRSGHGETFWQYRQAMPGDSMQSVDWRRSARSDGALYVREMEWEAAQTIWIWCDRARSMAYRSDRAWPRKRDRAAEIAAALALLLVKGGERFAIVGAEDGRPGVGQAQLTKALHALAQDEPADFGAPAPFAGRRGGWAVFISDFLGDEAAFTSAVRLAASQGLQGLLLQVIDPAEESFPFDGRIVFESMARRLRYETDQAAALREDYQNALARRRARMQDAAQRAGWRWSARRTNESAAPALLWLWQGLAGEAALSGLASKRNGGS